MCNRFFDYDDGNFAMSISDSMAEYHDAHGRSHGDGHGQRGYSHDLLVA